jgi:general secretion pathway protein K
MVLLLVLVVVALLSALLSDFAFSTLIDMRMTETFRDTARAEYLARGGITAGRMILQIDQNTFDAKNDLREYWSIGVQDYPLAEGSVSVLIDDLDGKLDLNKLVAGGAGLPLFTDRFIGLCTELGIAYPNNLLDALIDWLDADNQQVSAAGAEDAYYRSLDPSYEATDGPLRSIDELRLVRGFDAETVERLRPFVCCLPQSDGMLNINTASPELLRNWTTQMTPALADDLLSERDKKPFETKQDFIDRFGGVTVPIYTAITWGGDFIKVTSANYQITSQGQVNDGARRMQAIIAKTNDKLLWQKVN